MEKSDIRFHSSSHLSKQVSNSFTVTAKIIYTPGTEYIISMVTGRAGMVFIRY